MAGTLTGSVLSVQLIDERDTNAPRLSQSAVTIGVFDGVHLGHQLVIGETNRIATELGVPSVVITFEPHPASVVRPEFAPLMLATFEQRLELLGDAGADYVYVVHFDHERAQEVAPDFVDEVLVNRLGAKAVVVGEDFRFGHNRGGSVALLEEMGQSRGFVAKGLKLVADDGQESNDTTSISSTVIRKAIANTQVEVAAAMLGRNYELRGIVERGDARGRELGFPTANIAVPHSMCIPGDGIYAGYYVRPDGTRHMAAISLGRRPTFYETASGSLLEAYLLDFSGDLYGEEGHVEFVKFLRPELKFDSIEALIDQMRLDVDATRELLRAKEDAS